MATEDEPKTTRYFARLLLVAGGIEAATIGVVVAGAAPARSATAGGPHTGAAWFAVVLLALGTVALLGSAIFFPAHYPTWGLTDESLGEHQRRISTIRRRAVISLVLVTALNVGAGFSLHRAHETVRDLSPWAAGIVLACGALLVGATAAFSLPLGLVRSRAKPEQPLEEEVPRGDDQDFRFLANLQREAINNAAAARSIAKRWKWAHYVLGILVAGLAATSGGTGLGGGKRVAAFGILGLVGSAVAGVATLMNAGRNYEAADARASDWANLAFDIRRTLALGVASDPPGELRKAIESFSDRRRRITGMGSTTGS